MFHVTAQARIEQVVDTRKGIVRQAQLSGGRNIVEPHLFSALSVPYAISREPRDYIYLVMRAVTADKPNDNADAFPEPELLRMHSQRRCLTYQTFHNVPLHMNHNAADMRRARGFILDAHYNNGNHADKFVELVVATDRTKDTLLAEGLLSGRIRSASMGCDCAAIRCSICAGVFFDDKHKCDHLARSKMQRIGSRLVYNDCLGVTFTELSIVGDPADKSAGTRTLLGCVASRTHSFPMLDRLGLDAESRASVDEYFVKNLDVMPPSMAKLAEILWGN